MKQFLLISAWFLSLNLSAQNTCATALTINPNSSCVTGTVGDATVTIDGYNCGGTIVHEAWLKFTLNSSSTVTITASAANRNLALQLLRGTCGATTQISCANANNVNSSQTETISSAALAAGTYFIKILNVGTNSSMSLNSLCLNSTPDCGDALQVCSDITFTGNSSGFATQDLGAANRGCLVTNEHQSSWFFFSPATSGTLEMEIQTTVDYDFAIWQSTDCGNLGSPTRCSYAAATGNTGLAATVYKQISTFGCGFLGLSPCYGNVPVTDNSEDQNGDRYVAPLSISAGRTYIMVIDNFNADGTSYTLDFTLSNGATLNCTPILLPIEVVSFTGDATGAYNQLNWVMNSELNTSHFTIERSTDGENWSEAGTIASRGNAYSEHLYDFQDKSFTRNSINYYRLLVINKEGETHAYLGLVSLDNRRENIPIERIVNLMGQEVAITTSGIIIIQYADGTTEKRYNP